MGDISRKSRVSTVDKKKKFVKKLEYITVASYADGKRQPDTGQNVKAQAG